MYVLPMASYLVLTSLEPSFCQENGALVPQRYAVAYGVKLLVVAGVMWWARGTWGDYGVHFSWGGVGIGVVLGLVVAALWVGLDGRYPAIPLLGERSAFDPGALGEGGKWLFLVVRMVGLVVLVPVFEELFWRSFVNRYVIDGDRWESVPVGRVTLASGAVTAVLFALVHPEWLPALLTGLLWAFLLYRTKSLAACLASHVTANLALGVYVITTGAWKFL
jgi:CAAX prenyl protease-like protein